MRFITPKLRKHLNKQHTTLASCWKITTLEGKIYGFSDHDRDIIYNNVTYKGRSSFVPGELSFNLSLNSDKFIAENVITSDVLDTNHLLSGELDNAYVEVFLLNYNNPDDGIILLKSGHIGKVRVENDKFFASITSLKDNLNWEVGNLYSKNCRAQLGDKYCKIHIKKHIQKTIITEIIDNKTFKIQDIISDILKITLDNTSYEVAYVNYNKITTKSDNNLKVGQEIYIHPFCDKQLKTCINSFDNAINFRGEPHIPEIIC